MQTMSLTGPTTLHDLVPLLGHAGEESLEDKKKAQEYEGRVKALCLPTILCRRLLESCIEDRSRRNLDCPCETDSGLLSLRELPNTPVYWVNKFVPFEGFISLSQGFA